MTIDRKTFLKWTIGSGLGLSLNPVSISLTGKDQFSNYEGTEYHVSVSGSDQNDGSRSSPFRTIMRAAELAQPGDVITVHKGTYRERIAPPRGGTSDEKQIVYQAAEGEKVGIKGSEVIKDWKKFKGNVWKVTIPNSFFGAYNPYKDIIAGDWLDDHGRDHHTGQVYLNGVSLDEMDTLERVLNPLKGEQKKNQARSSKTWYCESDNNNTYIYANFHDYDPNNELVEINVRKSCFYPEKTGINYITIRGFYLSQAATQWAPPTAEQIGLIGTRWSKGWIIENNTISDSRCTAITLGKYGDKWDNTSEGRAEGYVETIKRAKENGWSKENIGHHQVLNNTITHCEQAGIVGSMGAIFSHIEGNHIHDIWAKRYFSGAEMAGIKIHAPIDSLIKNNCIHHTGRGIWLDWMTQGTHVQNNILYDNTTDDLFVEVNHGPFLIINNIFLSGHSIRDRSQGGAFAHNLIAGKVSFMPQDRETPYFAPHSTLDMKLQDIDGGDNRYYNNIFLANSIKGSDWQYEEYFGKNRKQWYGTQLYDQAWFPMYVDGNVYYNEAKPYYKEQNYVMESDFDSNVSLIEKEDGKYLRVIFSPSLTSLKTSFVNTGLLGKAIIPEQKYEATDGSTLELSSDYFGLERDRKNPTPGPFEEISKQEMMEVKVW